MNETKKLSTFINWLEYEILPKKVIEIAKNAIFDTIGVMIAGLNTPVGEKIIEYVEKIGGYPKATVLGTKFRTSVPDAALANGVLAHALDYDDIIPNMPGHPSVTIVPVLLALGEDLNLTGKDLITGYIAGFEVGTRINLGVMDEHYIKGWHNTATIGTISAASTAAKLLKLDKVTVEMALGIACSMLSGLRRNFGTMTKPLHVGNAARNGLVASILAKNGFTSRVNFLEGEGGFCQVYCGEEKCNLKRIVAKLNTFDLSYYTIINPGIGFKKYPTCYGTHQALDAIFCIMNEYNIITEQIEEVKCEVCEDFYDVLAYSNPSNKDEAKFSMQYCISRAILDKTFGFEQLSDDKICEKSVKELMKKIKLSVHKDLVGRWDVGFGFTIVSIKMINGKIFSKKVITPLGEPNNELPKDQLVSKFKECVSYSKIKINNINRIIESLMNLEQVSNMQDLIRLFKN